MNRPMKGARPRPTGVKQRAKSAKSSLQKWVERSLMLVVAVGVVFVAYAYFELYQRYREQNMPKDRLYGMWVEQEVAPYMADRFVIGKRGVLINGAVVSTDFKFDGQYFEYNSGGKQIKFILLDENLSKMKLVSDLPYQPVYQLSGSLKNRSKWQFTD